MPVMLKPSSTGIGSPSSSKHFKKEAGVDVEHHYFQNHIHTQEIGKVVIHFSSPQKDVSRSPAVTCCSFSCQILARISHPSLLVQPSASTFSFANLRSSCRFGRFKKAYYMFLVPWCRSESFLELTHSAAVLRSPSDVLKLLSDQVALLNINKTYHMP